MLYQVGASDPLTFAAVTLILLVAALGAAYMPAWRATQVSPASALRISE